MTYDVRWTVHDKGGRVQIREGTGRFVIEEMDLHDNVDTEAVLHDRQMCEFKGVKKPFACLRVFRSIDDAKRAAEDLL